MRKVRKHWYEIKNWEETYEEITLAAKLASTFQPVHRIENFDGDDHIDPHIFAWFLACKNVAKDSPRLLEWLEENGIHSGGHVSSPTMDPSVTEFDRYTKTYAVTSGWTVRCRDILWLDSTIPEEREKQQRELFLQKQYSGVWDRLNGRQSIVMHSEGRVLSNDEEAQHLAELTRPWTSERSEMQRFGGVAASAPERDSE